MDGFALGWQTVSIFNPIQSVGLFLYICIEKILGK